MTDYLMVPIQTEQLKPNLINPAIEAIFLSARLTHKKEVKSIKLTEAIHEGKPIIKIEASLA